MFYSHKKKILNGSSKGREHCALGYSSGVEYTI
jgi:hypothetical protein